MKINKLNYCSFLLFYFAFPPIVSAQNLENGAAIIWENKVYKEGIKSVLMYKSGWELSMPIIKLNSDDKVSLVFDEIGKSRNNYSYTIIHCSSNWQQTDIEPLDYIQGHETIPIRNYNFSQNTIVDYVNYWLEFPDDDCKPLISGNYVVKVFEDDDPDKIILTCRFYVIDPKVEISGIIEKLRIDHGSGLNQRVNFQVKYKEPEIENPTGTLSYKICKNNEFEKDFDVLKPSAIYGNLLRYENIEKLTFIGGNEYRHFDTKSFKFLSDCLEKIDKQKDAYHINLKTEFDKTNIDYKPETDLNGRYLVKLENNDRSHFMADYCYVNFELNAGFPIEDGSFNIYGDLSKWGFGDEFKMVYNQTKNLFEKKVFLKQGYFNYKYNFKSKDPSLTNNPFEVEGNHFQTENDYHILVYYKAYNQRFQELVGYMNINSNK